jgi:hypothetical protein
VNDAFRRRGPHVKRTITGSRRQKSLLAVADTYTRTVFGKVTEPLRDRVLTELRARLLSSGINTDDVDKRFFAFLL